MDTQQERLIKAQKKRSVRLARRRFLTVVTVLVLVLVFAIIMVDRFFVVRDIRIVSQSPFYTEAQIVEATGLTQGKNMFSFSEQSVKEAMLRRLSYFSDVKIRKLYPSAVEISFEEILGTMYVDVAGGQYILAPDFFVIAKAGEADLAAPRRMHVLCTGVYRCVVGEKIVMEDAAQLSLLENIYGHLSAEGVVDKIEYLDAADRFHITLNYAGKWEVDLGDSSELGYKVKMMAKVVEKATADYGPDTGGKIDVSGVTEAITKIYTPDAAGA